jgi:hypothetical protein
LAEISAAGSPSTFLCKDHICFIICKRGQFLAKITNVALTYKN